MCHSGDRKSQDEKGSKKSGGGSRQASASSHSAVQRPSRRVPITTQYPCDICGQFYSRRDNLRVHQRLHSGEMPYECRYCGQKFRWLGALRNHENNHSREGPSARTSTQASGSQHRGLASDRRTSASSSSSNPTPSRSTSERYPARRSSSRNGQQARPDEQRNRAGSSSGSRQRTREGSGSRARSTASGAMVNNSPSEDHNVIVREGDPLGSPIVEEPWHRVLDDQ